jgi:hypothetical protein
MGKPSVGSSLRMDMPSVGSSLRLDMPRMGDSSGTVPPMAGGCGGVSRFGNTIGVSSIAPTERGRSSCRIASRKRVGINSTRFVRHHDSPGWLGDAAYPNVRWLSLKWRSEVLGQYTDSALPGGDFQGISGAAGWALS